MLGVRHRLHDIRLIGFEETAILLLRAVGIACGAAVVVILTGSAASDFSGTCDLDLLREGLLRFLLHGNALSELCRVSRYYCGVMITWNPAGNRFMSSSIV